MWGKLKRKAQPVPVVNTIEERKVHGSLRKAIWGSVCRTSSFIGTLPGAELMGRIHLKAVQQAANSWSLFQVTQREFNLPLTLSNAFNGSVYDLAPVKTVSTMFEALDQLALFETTQGGSGFIIADADEKTVLGSKHFTAFGHREGILFDTRGMPHDTLDGELVTKGQFAEAEVIAFLKSYQPLLARLKGAEAGLSNATLAEFLLPEVRIPVQTFEKIIELGKKRDKFQVFTDALEAYKKMVVEWRTDCATGQSPFQGKMTKSLKAVAAAIEAIDFMDRDVFMRGHQIMELQQKIELSQVCLHHKKYEDRLKENVEFVRSLTEGLGLPRTAADALMMRIPDLANLEVAKPVQIFIGYCEQIAKDLDAAIAARKAGLKAEIERPHDKVVSGMIIVECAKTLAPGS